MFIRKTKKTHPETKKVYFVYQLIESVRTERGPRQHILLSLGSELDLPAAEHKALANRIEEIIAGSQNLVPYPEKIEQLAQHYASKLIERLSKQTSKESIADEQPDYQTIDLHTIEQQEARTVGAEHLLLHMTHQLQLRNKLLQLGFSPTDINLALGIIISRAIFPASERATLSWLSANSGLGELLAFDFSKISLDRFYRISDLLWKHKEDLESYLAGMQKQVHGYQSTMILYDLTNTYMEGQAKANPKAKHGRSKEKRSDCPLVTLGLVINEHGFVTRSEFLPGNVSEPATLEQAIKRLHSPEDMIRPTIVLDAGIATEENLIWLREHRYTYIVAARQDPPSEELETEPKLVEEGPGIKVALVKIQATEERWLYCESEAKTAVADSMKQFFQKRFEKDLQNMVEGLRKPKGRKQYEKILIRIGRLKEKHRRISGCYTINVTPSADGKTAIAIDWQVAPEKIEDRLNGHYYLRSNILSSGPVELWTVYNSIRVVEDAFRFMKSDLGMRPIYHQKTHRVDGHLWITLLAYHLIKSCLYQLKQNGVVHHWRTIRIQMNSRMRVTLKAQTQQGEVLYHRSTTKPEVMHTKIYTALGIPSVIGKVKKVLA